LEMVPLQQDHDANSLVESNRMLWISGALAGSNFSHASAALYDGQSLYPYLVTSTSSGDAGSVSSFFHSFANFDFNRRSKNFGQDTIVEDDDSARPSSLLAHVNAAARNTILGTPKNDYYHHKGEDTVVDDHMRPSTAGSH
ncbi:10422_t:CDS:2, partial [Acaulospora colombiana]